VSTEPAPPDGPEPTDRCEPTDRTVPTDLTDRCEPTDPALLRRAFGAYATGVTVVTVGGVRPHGMTANSFTSVSLDPPLVLFCAGRSTVMHDILIASGVFGVSVLAADQEVIARHFADRWRRLGQAQFDAVPWRPGRLTGAPLIIGALAHFECRLWRSYDGGDHTIFVGNLLALDHAAEDNALAFFHGRFSRLSPQPSEVPS
jgi:flavin reductase (DIM6/NTAB) family NADH-FMN oxidoreductase RutF